MENANFKATARKHKAIALTLTVLFHAALLGFLVSGGSTSYEDIIPQKVKEWLDKEDDKKEEGTKEHKA